MSDGSTKEDLINDWLKKYPHDKDSPDLETNAIAGYVSNDKGIYVWYSYKVYSKGVNTNV